MGDRNRQAGSSKTRLRRNVKQQHTCCGEIRLRSAMAQTTASPTQISPTGCAATRTTPAAARVESGTANGEDAKGEPTAQGERRT